MTATYELSHLQTTVLLRGITEHGSGAVFGGAHRDEEKVGAEERVSGCRNRCCSIRTAATGKPEASSSPTKAPTTPWPQA